MEILEIWELLNKKGRELLLECGRDVLNKKEYCDAKNQTFSKKVDKVLSFFEKPKERKSKWIKLK